jgi:hypothetical protein
MPHVRKSRRFDWSSNKRIAPITLKARFPKNAFIWLKQWKLDDVKEMRPHDTKWTEKDQHELLTGIRRVTSQPYTVEGDFLIVSERYAPSKNGFPGRLYSNGCQGLCRPVRANLLSETADMDMSMAMPRILLWICLQFDIPAPHLKHFVTHRDGPSGILQQLMNEMNVTKAKAKQMTNIPWTMGDFLRTHNKYMQSIDMEAKSVQQALMKRTELAWILDYCKTTNRPGSFISHLFQWVECKLLLRVHRMFAEHLRIPVTALVFDGLNIGDKSRHGDQTILDHAHAACEEVCPGINMVWAWKELDFTVESADKMQKIRNEDGSVKELRMPASYTNVDTAQGHEPGPGPEPGPKSAPEPVPATAHRKKCPAKAASGAPTNKLLTVTTTSAPRKPSAWDLHKRHSDELRAKRRRVAGAAAL